MAAERMAEIIERVEMLHNRLNGTEENMRLFSNRLDGFASTLIGLGDGQKQVQDEMINNKILVEDLQNKTGLAMDMANEQFDNHQKALVDVVHGAREEFQNLRAGLTSLYGGTGDTFTAFKDKVDSMAHEIADIQANSFSGGGTKKSHGFLPLKEQVPKPFGAKENDWRTWQDDVATYLDTVTEGMRGALKDAEVAAGEIDDLWVARMANTHGITVIGKSRELFRALKSLTEGEARMVVQGVKEERGFEAWRLLHMRYGLSTAAKQGQVMADVISIVQKPSKSPSETRARVIELERRVRVAEDVTGKPLDDSHVKSVLAAVLDAVTRAHTTHLLGSRFTYQDLKRGVLEFAANNSAAGVVKPADHSPMDIGALGETNMDESGTQQSEWEESGEQINAVGPSTQCYNCKGYGHVSAQCPSAKGKGKGPSAQPGAAKGKGKNHFGKGQAKGGNKGKGKGGPINGSCWTCGGPHFQQNCPVAAKGAKGFQKGAYSFEEWPLPEQHGIRCLSALATVNRYGVLAEEDEEDAVELKEMEAPQVPGHSKDVGCGICSRRAGNGENGKQAALAASDVVNYKAAVLGQLKPLATIEPANLCPVSEHQGWEVLDLAVDSGASETVIPTNLVKSVSLTPSDASKRGVQYEVANGERIPNLGEKAFTAYTDKEGYCRGIRAQVCDVSKPLLSVSRLVKAGNAVIFTPGGSYVEDGQTGERIALEEQGGMFNMRVWIPTTSSSAGF